MSDSDEWEDLGGFRDRPLLDVESSPESSPVKTRKITPRGHKFTNLDDAHLAITSSSRLVSGASQNDSTSSGFRESLFAGIDPNDPDVTAYGKALETEDQMRVQEPRGPVLGGSACAAGTRSLTNSFKINPSHPHSFRQNSEHSSKIPSDDLLVSSRYFEGEDSQRSANCKKADSASGDATGNTVENIYDQYLPSFLMDPSSSLSSGFNGTVLGEHARLQFTPSADLSAIPRALSPRDGAAGRANFQLLHSFESPEIRQGDEGINPSRNRTHLHLAPGLAPEVPLPELPTVYTESTRSGQHSDDVDQDVGSTKPSCNTSPNSVNLFGAAGVRPESAGTPEKSHFGSSAPRGSENSDLYSFVPVPLRIRSIKDRVLHESFISTGASRTGFSSSGAISTDSEDDPFKYDRYSFAQTAFVRPSREREVSAALRHLSGGSSTYTRTTGNSSPERNQRRASDPPPVPRIPPQMLKNGLSFEYSKNDFPFRLGNSHRRPSGGDDPWGLEHDESANHTGSASAHVPVQPVSSAYASKNGRFTRDGDD